MSATIWNSLDFIQCIQLFKSIRSITLHKLTLARTSYQVSLLQSKLVKVGLLLDTIDFSNPSQYSSQAIREAVVRTLDDFEHLALDALTTVAEELKNTTSPKLCVLAEVFSYSGAGEASSYLELKNLHHDVLEHLDNLTAELRCCERQILPPEPIAPPSGAESRAVEDLWHALYQHVSKLMTCSAPHETHNLRLFLGTLVDQNDTLRLLCTRCATEEWHPVDFAPTVQGKKGQETKEILNAACQLCTGLAKASKMRALKFGYDNEKIWPYPRGAKLDKERRTPKLQSLEAWLQQETARGHRKALQCILAQWLGHAYDTPWLPQNWDMKSIWLDESLPKESYRSLYTDYQPERAAGAMQGTPDAAFMMRFALLLLRIEFPEVDLTIEDEDDLDEMSLDEHLQTFLEHESINNKMEIRFKDVLTVCHEWDASSEFERQYILKQIFAPLQEELVFRFGLDVPGMPARPSKCGSADAIAAEAATKLAQVPIQPIASPSTPQIVLASPELPVYLYDEHGDAADPNQIKHAEEFFTRFGDFRTKHSLPAESLGKRVKIAILDTGFNRGSIRGLLDNAKGRRSHLQADHPEVDVIVKTKSFLPHDRKLKDECGHGTRVMNLLLRTAPDACYYIAKVSRTANDNDDDTVDYIAEALDWAMEHEVDMINMSFGFPRAPEDSLLNTKLRAAYSKGIVMFAAAANHGRNGPRAYPACAHEVICIHASSGRGGWAEDLNPSTSRFLDKWSTLGLGINFVESDAAQRSGTSYATPIAVGTIANVIDYVRYLHQAGHLTPSESASLQNYDGIQHIMRLLSTDSYLAPWHLWKDDKVKVADIAARLRWR